MNASNGESAGNLRVHRNGVPYERATSSQDLRIRARKPSVLNFFQKPLGLRW